MWLLGLGDAAAAAADEQNNKIIVFGSRGGASVISTSGNAIQCAGLHHIYTAPGHTAARHSGISYTNVTFLAFRWLYSQFWVMNV